jgi:pimeloyl-ACP methyl ester carboxylesterase
MSDGRRRSPPAQVEDLEAVVAAVARERFVLLGISQGSTVLAFAARYPERFRVLLYGGYARLGRRGSRTGSGHRAIVDLALVGGGTIQRSGGSSPPLRA